MKKAVITILQVLLAIGLIAWILKDEEKRQQTISALSQADVPWAIAGIALLIVAFVIMTLRWWLLVRVQEIEMTFRRAAVLTFIGHFFSQFLPGGTGGDLYRMYYAIRESKTGQKSAAFLSVLMDRFVGVASLILIASGIVLVRAEDILALDQQAQWVVGGFFVLALGVFGFLGISMLFAIMGWVHKLPQWVPLRSKFIDLSAAYHVYGKNWKGTAASFFTSIGGHIVLFMAFHAAALAIIGPKIDPADPTAPPPPKIQDSFTVAPITNALTAIPLTPGGVGFRELLVEKLLVGLGDVDKARAAENEGSGAAPAPGLEPGESSAADDTQAASIAVAISALYWIMFVSPAFVGGIIFMFYRASGDLDSMKEISAGVDAAESEVEEAEEAAEIAAEEARHPSAPVDAEK